jgi:hypothetical protein
MTQGKCRLCGLLVDLRESHILPAFAIRWLKNTTPGKIRSTEQPNRRVQDGLKEYWLCEACEQRFSKSESLFAEKIFGPFSEGRFGDIEAAYGPWALKFASSVSWRVLLFFRDRGLPHLSADDRLAADRALATWSDFLLDRREHPGVFEQHVVHLDAPTSTSDPSVSPFLSRYLLRAWDLDVVTSNELCVTYAKLCRVAVFGVIRARRPREWKGTKLHVREGTVGHRDIHLPGFLPHYWNDRADLMGRSLEALSPPRSKIASVFTSTPAETLAQSEAFRAMTADIQLSGNAAFGKDDNGK